MNLQLLEPAIAPHISGTRQWCPSRCVRLVISLFAVWLFATAAFALDPQKSITQFAHTVWTEKDGAPADIVAITQTSDGYLWLGTPTGLFSFDGIRFAHFEPRTGEDLPSEAIPESAGDSGWKPVDRAHLWRYIQPPRRRTPTLYAWYAGRSPVW